ncbi:MAG: hypothetical protein AB1664_08990, partial [Thermodesulfobacteriota bacterium]
SRGRENSGIGIFSFAIWMDMEYPFERKREAMKEWAFRFRILVKREDDLWLAHCLELDLVATASSEKQLQEDIVNVIVEQVRYCLVNDNMDYLFRRAPQEVWDEYRACEKHAKSKLLTRKEGIASKTAKRPMPADLPPFSFTANACWAPTTCHAV